MDLRRRPVGEALMRSVHVVEPERAVQPEHGHPQLVPGTIEMEPWHSGILPRESNRSGEVVGKGCSAMRARLQRGTHVKHFLITTSHLLDQVRSIQFKGVVAPRLVDCAGRSGTQGLLFGYLRKHGRDTSNLVEVLVEIVGRADRIVVQCCGAMR